MRRLSFIMVLVLLAVTVTACGSDQPPTVVYVVFSPTPEPATAEVLTVTADAALAETAAAESTATPTALPASKTPSQVTPGNTNPPSTGSTTNSAANAQTVEPQATVSPATARPTTAPVQPTILPDIYPTNTAGQIQLAEQVFEGGRMFWIRFNRQIWVMLAGDNPRQGDWFCYYDTFEEGEPEIDPEIIPPADRYQPRRGFGKLWRNLAEIRDKLGWAITPEFELTSDYTYLPGGYVEDGVYYPGPGEHRLNTLYNEPVSFFETEIRGDCQGGTWRMPPSQ